ncbi:hypothetical protein DFH07DRAFT_783075 [Mycena maculata]|uniref:Uncharacterized protein n=1 Tax=Mycena maculata TaxID=230809 RepID=A0AAD7MNA4_9AGAR|nr:hypothetical protein DFH07DRAFT_783075 [Mycena maculata]
MTRVPPGLAGSEVLLHALEEPGVGLVARRKAFPSVPARRIRVGGQLIGGIGGRDGGQRHGGSGERGHGVKRQGGGLGTVYYYTLGTVQRIGFPYPLAVPMEAFEWKREMRGLPDLSRYRAAAWREFRRIAAFAAGKWAAACVLVSGRLRNFESKVISFEGGVQSFASGRHEEIRGHKLASGWSKERTKTNTSFGLDLMLHAITSLSFFQKNCKYCGASAFSDYTG